MAEPVSSPPELSPLKRALLALEKMEARLNAVEGERHEPIAVIGMGCRFPGGVDTPESFWRLLAEGRDAVGHFPADRPGAAAWQATGAGAEKLRLVGQGGFLAAVDQFDPGFFAISPREAMRMDPQQRLLLQVAYEAIESAGLVLEQLAGSRTGVFIGLHSQSSDYYLLQTSHPAEMDTYTSTGSAHSIAANRLSYVLDLRGPSIVVDTACSSSLVALHLACQSLRARESNVALVGGVNLILAPETSLAFSQLEFLSPDGRCKTFDASANGFVRAEGCGVIVLKRLAEAVRDGDPVLAVVRGTAVNQDGATNGLTAPNGLSQQAVIKAALENGRVDPAQVTLLETHGTGTTLGDPIEVDALRSVFGGGVRRALGAVKSNIGHTEAAAGIAGVIKCVLALQHRTIPANLHFQTLNPHISLAGSAFFVPTEAVPWEGGGQGRFAGVSSFGFGGTNGHVILQEAPAAPPAAKAQAPGAVLLPLSARSAAALDRLAALWRQRLDAPDAATALPDLVFTAAARRSHHLHRLAVVGSSADELRSRLAELDAGRLPAGVARGSAETAPRIAFVLCGQGPQWWGMGRELLQSEPEFRRVITQCAEEMKGHVAWDLLAELARNEVDSRLDQTEFAQPALFALQLALAAVWRSWGVEPQAVVGHSVGEVAAAVVAGALSLSDGVKVICHRGKLMQRATGLGRMAAIELPGPAADGLVEPFRDRVAVAALNSPTSTVISGEANAVEQVVAAARERGARTKLLPVNYAFHSPQMEPFREAMSAAVAGLAARPAAIPLYAGVTGALATAEDFGAAYWGRNLREPVRFAPAIQAMLRDDIDTFIELSPQPVLAAMVAQCADAANRKVQVLPSLRAGRPERGQMLEALAGLYAHGATVRWGAVGPGGRHTALPGYPWQNRSLWLENPAVSWSGAKAGAAPRHGTRLHSPGITGVLFEKPLDLRSAGFVRDHRILGACIVPAPVLVEMILGGAAEAFATDFAVVQDLVLHRAVVLAEEAGRCVHLVYEPVRDGGAAFSIHSRSLAADSAPQWVLHASGRVLVPAERPAAAAAAPTPDFAAIRRRLPDEMPPAQFYDYFAGRGADFGPAFRVVERFHHAAGEALVEVALPDSLQPEAAGYFLHPVLWDAALQAIAVQPSAGPAEVRDPDRLFLFCGFDALRLGAAGGVARLVCHARLDPAGADARGAFRGTVSLYSPVGVLLAEITGARFLPADRESLIVAGGPVQDLLHEVRWQPRHHPGHRLRRAAPLPLPTLAQAKAAADAFLREQARDPRHAHRPDVVAEFDAQSIRYIKSALRQLGWIAPVGRRFTPAEMIHELKILPNHARLAGRMLDLLGADGTLRGGPAGWEMVRPNSPTDTPVSLADLLDRYPDHRAELVLFDRCASRLGEVLQGRCDPLQLLFPDGSTESATRLYQDAPMSRLPNALMRALCERVRDAVPPGGVLRVLEIGAGTGGTTAHLLPLLAGVPCEYVFSDVSALFLEGARARFADFPFLRFTLLDIERPPAGQGFAPGQFDLVIAANVIHATQDLRRTLAHLRSLLAPGGLVALLEGFRPSRWVDLVFGQTDGWWRFTDTDLRPDHPLVSVETWCRILRETGFADATGIAAKLQDEPGLFDQAVILAKAPGTVPSVPRKPAVGEGQQRPWLVIDDHSPHGGLLAGTLAAAGHAVARIASDRVGPDLASGLAAPGPLLGHVVLFSGTEFGTTAEDVDALFVQATSLAARALAVTQALIRNPQTPRPRLWLVTSGAQPAGGATPLVPAAAALWGLGRVLAIEHPEIWGGLIDLDPAAESEANVEQLLAQIRQYDGEDQCAFRSGVRHVPRLVARRVGGPESVPDWNLDGCHIVTGGLGGLGLHLAHWLAEQGARKLVLIGRTPLPPRAEWDNVDPDSRTHEQVAAVREIERRGASVRMISLDIAIQSGIARVLTELQDAGWLPVRGVVHSAAAIDDRLVPLLDEASITTVMRPKALGALRLAQGLAGQPLQYFACCSSIGSLLGQAGQANYAAANAFLDSFVHQRRQRGLPALGINWGGWYGAGFAVTAGGRRTIQSLEQRGILGFAPAEGVAAFGLLLRGSAQQATVMRLDEARFRQSYPPGEEPPLLRGLAAATSRLPSAPSPSAGRSRTNVRQQILALDSGAARRAQLQAHVTSLLAAVLKLEPGAIDAARPMGTLGLDSLMGFELKNRCEQSLDLTLSATMAWNYPTVAALTDFLAEKLGVSLVEDAVPVATGNGPAITLGGAGTGELSEDQALRALLGRRNMTKP